MKNINKQTPLKNPTTLYNKEELSTQFNLGYRYKLHEINKISEKMGFANSGNLFVRLGHIGHSIDQDIQKAVKYMNSSAKASEDHTKNIRSNPISEVNNLRKNKYLIEVNSEDFLKEKKSNFVIKTKILGEHLNLDHSLKASRHTTNSNHLVSDANDRYEKLTENNRRSSTFLNGSTQIRRTIKLNSIFADKNKEMPPIPRNSNFLKLATIFGQKDKDHILFKSTNEIKIPLSDYSENNSVYDFRNATSKSNEKSFTEKIMTISKFKIQNEMKIKKFDEEEKDYSKKEKFENFSQDGKKNKRRNKNGNNFKSTNFNFAPRKNDEIIYFEREKEKNKTYFSNFNKNESKTTTVNGTFFEENKNEFSEHNTGFKQINLYNVSQYKNEKMKKFYGELDYNCKKLESIDFKIKTELSKAYKICDVFEKKMNK